MLRRRPVTGGDIFDLQIVATMKANGAMIITRSGMRRPVMPTNTRMFWPSFVIRSMSRSACVIHINRVTLTSTSRNAPKVVRKI